MSEKVISDGGIVFGACFSDNGKTVVFDSTDHVALEKLRTSKYVESYTKDIFVSVRDNLEKGRKVLFCGTPCQVAGLSKFLRCKYDNLLLCDFACGGLSSHRIFEEYLNWLEKKYKSEVVSVNFRPKKFGWSKYHILIEFSNGKQYCKLAYTDPYFYGFLFGRITVRENCYSCEFSNKHLSDVTLADYWRYVDTPEIKNDEKGISLLIANTDRGISALDELDNMHLYPLELKKAAYNYTETTCNDRIFEKREKFFSKLKSDGLVVAAKEIGMPHGIRAEIINVKAHIRHRHLIRRK